MTLSKQRALIASVSSGDKAKVKKYCRSCQQQGDGIKEILQKVKDTMGPIIKDVGPKVLKEFIIPLLLQEAKNRYLTPAGKGLSLPGAGLKLSGQGKKTSPWILHVKKVSKDKNISYKDAMKVAAATYKK